MDLKPLPNSEDVSPQEFSQLFEGRLGALFSRAMHVLITLGLMHSFSVANVIHLGLQKDIVEDIVEALEKWCELFPKAPDPITAHVDTKQYFDIMYGEFFMTATDTVDGLGPFETVGERNGHRQLGIKQGQSKLWVPDNAR